VYKLIILPGSIV